MSGVATVEETEATYGAKSMDSHLSKLASLLLPLNIYPVNKRDQYSGHYMALFLEETHW